MSEGATTDLTGRKIGEYEISAKIGIGGMGVVYEGRQPLIGKRVAVKVLLPSLSNEKELVERFLAEARAVNEIRHRGIVDIFSFGQLPDGSHYFVMEFLDGQPFDKILKTRRALPVAEALSYTEEVLDALESAHAAGIVHRDIKPSNLFLVNTGRGKAYVKLLDFGIAKLGALTATGDAAPQTRASVILGTPDYISPEQARGKPITAATDLYALGVVLFEMVTGQRPFRAENTLQTMWMHVEDPPPVPSSIRPEIPPALDELILWALEKDPANRPHSAEEMRAHLESVRASLLPGVGSTTPAPITGRSLPLSAIATPSGRQPSLPGTPAPRTGGPRPLSLTPPPRSGTQRPVGSRAGELSPSAADSQQTRVASVTGAQGPVADGQHTRVASMTGAEPMDNQTRVAEPTLGPRLTPSGSPIGVEKPTDPARSAVPRTTEANLDEVTDPPKSVLPLIIAGVSALAIVGGLAVLAFSGGSKDEAPAPQVVVPNAPAAGPEAVVVEPRPTPVVVAPPEPTPVVPPAPSGPVEAGPKPPEGGPKPSAEVAVVPPPVVQKPEKAPEPVRALPEPKKPADPPKPRGVTQQQLEAKLAKVEARLAKREASMGEPDKMIRKFLEPAKKAVTSATSDADRKDAFEQLDDLDQQLR